MSLAHPAASAIPSPRTRLKEGGLWSAFWGLFSALVLLQTSPWVTQTPGNDAGVFLYLGSEILQGKLPFVDLWDHKPPLIFYLNFTLLYSTVSTPERVGSLLDALAFLNTRSGFFILGSMAWLGGIAFILLHHEAALYQVTRRWVGVLPLLAGLFLVERGLLATAFHLAALASLSLYRWGLVVAGVALLCLGGVALAGVGERRIYPWLKPYQVTSDSPALLPVYLALLDLPVELLMISLSGRGYLHYNISLFPPLTILIAFLAGTLWDGARRRIASPGASLRMLAVWSVVLLLPVAYGGLGKTIEKIHPGADRQTSLTVDYIQQNTRPGDTILMWGSQTGLYFLSGRESASRYVHQVPLISPQYATPQRIGEFLQDIQKNKPVLIVDTRQGWFPLPYTAGGPAACAQVQPSYLPGMEPVYRYICANYVPVATIGPDSWIIYRYNPVTLLDGN